MRRIKWFGLLLLMILVMSGCDVDIISESQNRNTEAETDVLIDFASGIMLKEALGKEAKKQQYIEHLITICQDKFENAEDIEEIHIVFDDEAGTYKIDVELVFEESVEDKEEKQKRIEVVLETLFDEYEDVIINFNGNL